MVPIVVIDARMVTDIPHGIARYVVQLAKGLRQKKESSGLPYEPVFLVNPSSPIAAFAPFQTEPISANFLNPKEMFEIPKVLSRLKAAIYHSPSFSSLFSCPCPSIVTIHDLNHLTYGEWSKKIYYELLLRRFALSSRALVTVSEFSRQEISTWLKIPLDQIEIVSNAIDSSALKEVDQATSERILKQFNLQRGKYFFCLSNPKPHKNLALLVQAYQTFKDQQPEAWPLVLSVSDFSSIPGIQSVGALSDIEANALLANTGGMFFPSLYEGFGLPPLEAAVFGIPLAISKIPPHQEGLIDLAPSEVLWTDPKDLKGWVDAFHQISQGKVSPPSPASREKILKRFSSQILGQRMDTLYQRSLIGNLKA